MEEARRKKSFELKFRDDGRAEARIDGEHILVDNVAIEKFGKTNIVRVRQSFLVEEVNIVGEHTGNALTVETEKDGEVEIMRVFPSDLRM